MSANEPRPGGMVGKEAGGVANSLQETKVSNM